MTAGKDANPPVNASGRLTNRRAYDGPNAFKHLLVQDLDRFAEALVEQLATFAQRRAMTVDDAAQIKSIGAACKASRHNLRGVTEQLVGSELFGRR